MIGFIIRAREEVVFITNKLNTNRRILHCDLNAFYASVELLDHPELAHQPVAVSGNPKNRHGIILAKNEAAKAFGVKTAETIFQAKKKCPGLITLTPHHDKYKEYSQIINAIYRRYTDYVEPFSIDESWLDITDTWRKFAASPRALADLIRSQVREETRLTISVGLSFNKIFSKLGSDYKKPDALTVITPENYQDILWPLPVGDLTFAGRQAVKKMGGFGIKTIGDLARFDRRLLVQVMGKHGAMLYDYANGYDDRPVRKFTEPREVKSIGNGKTFGRDLYSLKEVEVCLRPLCQKVASRLKAKDFVCKGLGVTIKDADFVSISRQKTLGAPTNSEAEIFRQALEIIKSNWTFAKGIRLLTVTATHLLPADKDIPVQISFFDPEKHERQVELEKALAGLQKRFGDETIGKALAKPQRERGEENET